LEGTMKWNQAKELAAADLLRADAGRDAARWFVRWLDFSATEDGLKGKLATELARAEADAGRADLVRNYDQLRYAQAYMNALLELGRKLELVD